MRLLEYVQSLQSRREYHMFDQFDDFADRLLGNDLTCFLSSYVRIGEMSIARSRSLESISMQDLED